MSRADIKTVIRQLALEGSNGLMCPFCSGGRTKEKSFSITARKDGVILYICHRAKCGAAGRVDNGHGAHILEPTFVPRLFNGETRELSEAMRELLAKKYGLTDNDLYWHEIKEVVYKSDIEPGKIVVPIYSPYAQRRGVEARLVAGEPIPVAAFEGRQFGPKTLHYKEVDEPWQGWFYKPDFTEATEIVLVEDTISAMKVSGVTTCVALLGSHVTLEQLMEVLKYGDNIILALDKDATDKAWKLQKKYQFIAPKLRVLPLQRDLKYESRETIKERLGELRAT